MNVSSVELIEESDSDVVVIAFGGVGNSIDMPPFEFMGMLSGFDVAKIFLRDLDQCYYHKGLIGVSSNIDETKDFINDLINGKSSLFIGHSMGGYAAILFGILCNADRVLAFSPQIVLSDELRWGKYMAYAVSVDGYTSLVPLLEKAEMPIEVHFSEPEKSDMTHANLIPEKDNINVVLENLAGHHIALLLKRAGRLKKIISTNVLLISP